MIAFKVTHNGKQSALAGTPDLSVLTVFVTANGRLGPDSYGSVGLTDHYSISLEIGGLTSRGSKYRDEFVHWHRTSLNVGDVVTVEVVESDFTDEPKKRKPVIARRKDFLPLARKGARRRRGEYIRKLRSGTRTIYD